MTRFLIAVCAAATLSGCVSPNANYDVKAKTDQQLVDDFVSAGPLFRPKGVGDELHKRGSLSDRDMELLRSGKIGNGMSKNAVLLLAGERPLSEGGGDRWTFQNGTVVWFSGNEVEYTYVP